MIDPHGRVVMLSGATGGIGAAITRRLSEDGFRLSLGVRNVDAAREAFPGLEADGGLIHRFEAGEADTAKAWVDATAEHFGQIDVLINNAGILRQVFFDEGDEDLLDELWTVNVKAPFRLIRHALPHLSETGGGRIINVGSTDAKRYRAGVSVGYAMSKHALMAMSHAAKAAGWEHGVRVTALCPGAVDTPMIQSIPGVTPVDERIQPTDLAEIVAFLLGLPNNASVPELVVNTRLESGL
ncbi:MAG: SDR family NAD(P)-dependent oxidoreductase [Gemmatimonadales bacterium]|jgi:NAD(P)-dependent dehydrogenase (short-subunit alcohol dehydrogenase family)|nr:SDR family NAD(P)-dependent oxidoreductase [Gemmatimonadales bacterium]MBT6375179.1 SDR family NAD(P)-dependent oxidoreductase [Gemmatimonadales bacterium]MBT7125978.1 SDR family NAD(P)-dependent oxidoreductase [Gemmatimonadales bacterium]